MKGTEMIDGVQQSGTKVVFKSLFWKFFERCGVQVTTFVTSVILARLLMPEDYGVLSMLLVFITIAQVFVQGGLATALVQKKAPGNDDYSGVFYISLLWGSAIYLLFFLVAPIFADFFAMPMMTPTLRVLGCILPVGALYGVLNAMFVKRMQFFKVFVCNMLSSLLSGIVGIALAYSGYGLWALVFQQIVQYVSVCIFMELFLRWIPGLPGTARAVGDLTRFGYKIILANLISTSFNELRSVLIGKNYSSAALAYYDRGKQIPSLVNTNINHTIDSVMFPVYVLAKNDPPRLKQMLRNSMQMSSFVVFPIAMGLISVAERLIVVLYTEKWLPSVPFLVINALIYCLAPLQTANAQVINAMGRSDIMLKLEIMKKSLGLLMLLVACFCFDGVIYIAYAGLLIAILASLINMYPNTKLLGYAYLEQLRDILPAAALSFVMLLCVKNLPVFFECEVAQLVLQVVCGAVVYGFLALLTRNQSMLRIVNVLKSFLTRKKV